MSIIKNQSPNNRAPSSNWSGNPTPHPSQQRQPTRYSTPRTSLIKRSRALCSRSVSVCRSIRTCRWLVVSINVWRTRKCSWKPSLGTRITTRCVRGNPRYCHTICWFCLGSLRCPQWLSSGQPILSIRLRQKTNKFNDKTKNKLKKWL